ncbi:actin related protein 2/3 complex, subunit 5, partial [Phenoliferia sp. Uapishka_3]
MAEGSWRRLPVDQYDEDRVLASDLYIQDPRPVSDILAAQQQKQTAVRGFLQRGDAASALKEGLRDAPYGESEVDPAKLVERAGVGCIVRVMSDRRRV